MIVKKSACGAEFQNNAKKFVINMVRGSERTLHIKNTKCCPWSEFLHEYVDFDTEEEAKASGIDYVKCQNCFKGE